MQFNGLPIADGTKDAIAAMGYEEATPIQKDAIPHLLAGRDVVGKAQTGTGKTAAFGIPIIDRLRDAPGDDVLGLVLVPTRELALQVTEVLTDLARGSRLQVVPIFGGTGFGKQLQDISRRGAKVVVACPGRLLDLCGRGDLRIDRIQELVLDEADRMLDMGFIHDMRKVLKLVPAARRTSLWSATISREIRELAGAFLRDPVTVEVATPTTATTLTEQFHVRVEKSDKKDVLLALLAAERPDKAVVFTRTKHLAKRLAQQLDKEGWASVALQGNMTQGQRERAMAAFRESRARLLVATDVAARGLDVPDVTHVVNFDLPTEPESYVHRVGRTGRNGRTGRSFSFVQSDEHNDWRTIERLAGMTIPRHTVDRDGVSVQGPDEPLQPAMAAPQGRPGGGGQASDRPRPQSGSGAPRQGGRRRRSGPGQGSRHVAAPQARQPSSGGRRRRRQ